ncbi:hypothetical protein BS78_06G203800 [Paspalum vaginatum]|nr:hypothetical protein BS78_06G203800 [Paspalum vaginatum]
MDGLLTKIKLPCQNVQFGCTSQLVYYQATEHQGACKWAPCFCPNPGCEFFSSPARLVEHFRNLRHWSITGVSYRSPYKVPVPAPPQGCHVLVGEEERSVFLVSSATATVSLVCVRAKGAGAALQARALRVDGAPEPGWRWSALAAWAPRVPRGARRRPHGRHEASVSGELTCHL